MTLLKNLAAGLLSSLFFLALTVFGFAYAVQSTILNPDFITTQVNRLDIPALINEMVQIENPPEFPDLDTQINQAIIRLEPDIKKQTTAATDSVYDYLLGNKPEPELASIIRQTFLSADFITQLLNSVNISPFLAPAVTQQLEDAISPIVVPELEAYISQALTATEPALKQQLINASGPISDYLLGTASSLDVTLDMREALASLKNVLRDAFINSPPAGIEIGGIPLTAIPQNMRGPAFDAFYPTIIGGIPTTFTIDQSLIPLEVPEQFRQSIAGAEGALAQVRPYVAQAQGYYPLLIAFTAAMALGIILILRDVKGIASRLGVPLLTTGALEYAGILIGKSYLTPEKIGLGELPVSLQTWAIQFSNDLLKPAETFALTILIIGVVLVVVSFVYKRGKAKTDSSDAKTQNPNGSQNLP